MQESTLAFRCHLTIHSSLRISVLHLYLQFSSPTVCVTRWWARRDNAALAEPASSQEKCLKTRRLPPVGCTLCWHACSFFQFLFHSRRKMENHSMSWCLPSQYVCSRQVPSYANPDFSSTLLEAILPFMSHASILFNPFSNPKSTTCFSASVIYPWFQNFGFNS